MFSFKKMCLKMSSGKWRPSWLSLNVLSNGSALNRKWAIIWADVNQEVWLYRTGVLSDIEWLEWLNTTQLKYPDCSYIVESDTYPSPGVTRLYPSWLGTWLTWSPCGHCNMQWDTCYHLVAMAAGERVTNQSHYMITPWGVLNYT